jgi:hypothetical protein
MMELSETQNPPVLDYNLPQTTSFVANVYLPLSVGTSLFKAAYKDHLPSGESYYDKVASFDAAQVGANIANAFAGVVASESAAKSTDDSMLGFSPATNLADSALIVTGEGAVGVLDPKINGLGFVQVGELAKNGFPVITTNLAGKSVVTFKPKPDSTTPLTPEITMVEHCRVNTYLGRYGAGETVKTFTLLPGEKTTISVKTYKQTVSNKRDIQNVLDSFSNESASDLENLAEQESNTQTKKSTYKDTQISGGLNLPIKKVNLNVNASFKKTTNSERAESIKTLNRAISKQSQKSVSNRKVEVNTESNVTTTESEETHVIRILENLNKSRTLNFVFRQLNQELITITYLDDVTFVFSNGYEEKKMVTKIDGLLEMLEEVLTNSADALDVFEGIINQLGNVYDYEDASVPKAFLEKYTENIWDFFNHTPGSPWPPTAPPQSTPLTSFGRFRKDSDLTTSYTPYEGANEIQVKGIIKNITHRVLPTDSVIVDAILGQGEALDCFNIKLQDAEVVQANLLNDEKQQAIDIITSITDPAEKAALYKKVFSDCCDVAQSGCGCNQNIAP